MDVTKNYDPKLHRVYEVNEFSCFDKFIICK